MARVLSHDGFARRELIRQTATVSPGASCDWCGNVNWSRAKNPVPQLYSYGTRADDSLRSSINRHRGLFCSKSCHDSYHGES